jgi:hypothetical protein
LKLETICHKIETLAKMRSIQLILLMALSLPAWAAEPIHLGLMVEFPRGTPQAVTDEFQRETGRALRLPEVAVEWRVLGSDSDGVFDRLVVIRLHGACTQEPAAGAGRRSALGLTHTSDGLVLPFVEIDCDRVNSALERAEEQSNPFVRARTLGRALGRVAAHEIHHVLTFSGVHDGEGLTKHAFSRADLTAPELVFSAPALDRLRRCLGGASSEQHGGGQQRSHAEE